VNCHEATFLLSQQRERQLTLLERVRVRLHGVVCPACLRFGAQASLMGDAARAYAAQDEEETPQ